MGNIIDVHAADLLKFAAAIVRRRIDWTTDEIGGACCEHGHDIPLDALMELRAEIDALAARCGDLNAYSDGRTVKSGRWIEDGVYTEHVWNPDKTTEPVSSWRGNLLHDPDTPCPGVYEVSTYPATQEIHIRIVKVV